MYWDDHAIRKYLVEISQYYGTTIAPEIVESQSMNNIFLLSDNGKVLKYSPLFLNHQNMSDETIRSILVFVYSSLICRSDGVNSYKILMAIYLKICKQFGLPARLIDDYEDEIRSVRRSIFSDNSQKACYFSVGDVIRSKIPGNGPYRYVITDISPLINDKIMITYHMLNDHEKKYCNEEKFVYDRYSIVDHINN